MAILLLVRISIFSSSTSHKHRQSLFCFFFLSWHIHLFFSLFHWTWWWWTLFIFVFNCIVSYFLYAVYLANVASQSCSYVWIFLHDCIFFFLFFLKKCAWLKSDFNIGLHLYYSFVHNAICSIKDSLAFRAYLAPPYGQFNPFTPTTPPPPRLGSPGLWSIPSSWWWSIQPILPLFFSKGRQPSNSLARGTTLPLPWSVQPLNTHYHPCHHCFSLPFPHQWITTGSFEFCEPPIDHTKLDTHPTLSKGLNLVNFEPVSHFLYTGWC